MPQNAFREVLILFPLTLTHSISARKATYPLNTLSNKLPIKYKEATCTPTLIEAAQRKFSVLTASGKIFT